MRNSKAWRPQVPRHEPLAAEISGRQRWSLSTSDPAAYQPRSAKRPPPRAVRSPTPSQAADAPDAAVAQPPAPAACSSAYRSADNERSPWQSDCRRALPCWLVSMALHLLLVIVLGSIVAPVSSRRVLPAILLLSFAKEEALQDQSPVLLASSEPALDEPKKAGQPMAGQPAAASAQADASAADRRDDSLDELIEPEDEAAEMAQVRIAPELGAPVPEETSPADEAAIQRPPSARGKAGVSSAARIPPPDDPRTDGPKPVSQPARASAEERRLDDVVHRFIQFDIGRLQGEAGQQARRDFDRLGPEAIPALVRGLNKSARIYASCPVMVISNKLGEVMDENRDPAMLQYVADHLGENVPPNAPHMARIRALKNRLLGGDSDADVPPVDSPMSRIAALTGRLTGANRADRLAAAREIINDDAAIPPDARAELAWPLIRRLSDHDRESSVTAHRALVVLADGEDCGPDNLARASRKEITAAASRWYAHFDQQRYETMAASVLASARHFEEARRKSSAMRYYRKVLEEYGGTAAAQEAAERIKALSKFELR